METPCPLCKSTTYQKIGLPKTNAISKEFVDKDYFVVQCNECDVYYISPLISFNDDQWADLYNVKYFDAQSNWLLKKRAVELSQRFDNISSYLTNKDDVRLLDIGTGEGKALVEGLKRGWNVTGLDIVDNRKEIAKDDRIAFVNGKFLEHQFPDNHFDAIYLDSVLEHVLNPKEYLLKINRILKKGGVVYIGVPNEDSLFNDVKKFVFFLLGRSEMAAQTKPFDAPYHVIGFNRKSLGYIFNITGLNVLLLRNFGRKFNFLSHPPNKRGFWLNLIFLLPVEFIGKIIGRDVYFEAYVTKE